jgi:selenocysteine lyase/cysteine desulfurase
MESIGESKTTTAAAIASTGTHGISKDGQSENIFGHSMRRHFRIAESYFNLNHGSFGCVPKVVSEAQVGFIATCESRPDKWFRQTYFKHVKNSRRKIAKLINADQADVVLVEGASSSMNGVLRSFPFKVVMK